MRGAIFCGFALACLLVFATTAQAQEPNGWTQQCQDARELDAGVTPSVTALTAYCYPFDNSQSGSPDFWIGSESASVCLWEDTGGTGTTASVAVQACAPTVTASDNSCFTLDTLSSDSCQSYSKGYYRLSVTAAGAGEEAVVEIRGFGVSP